MFGSGSVRKIATVVTARDEATGKLEDAEEAGDQAAESMGSTEESARNLRREMSVLAGVAGATTGALGLLVRQHGQTEQTMAQLETVTGATSEEMRALRDEAMRVGQELPVSIGQATEAFRQLSFAGFSAEESMAAANDVAELAVATSLDMGAAARTSASALRMFSMDAEDLNQITSSMSAVLSEAATDVRELSSAIERAGATASMLGAEFEEVASVVGVMSDQGIRAERAGTAVESMLSRFTQQSGRAEEAMNELGLSMDDFVDESGELVDVDVMMARVAERLGELDNQIEKVSVAQQLFGQRGARAVLSLSEEVDDLGALIDEQYTAQIADAVRSTEEFKAVGFVEHLEEMHAAGADTGEMVSHLEEEFDVSADAAEFFASQIGELSTEELTDELENATTASELAADQMDTAAGSVEFLRSSIDAFTFSVSQGANPAIQSFNQTLASGINVVNEHRAVGAAIGSVLVGVAGATGLATVALGAHIAQLKIANVLQGQYVTQTAAGTVALKAKAVATGAATRAQWLMTASTWQLLGATKAKSLALWGSVTALGSNTVATLANASAKGVLATAASAAVWPLLAVNAALGPIGIIALLAAGSIAALAAVMHTDLFGASDRAASILGRVGDAGRTTVAVLHQLLGIGKELGRIGLTAAGLGLLAPFAAILAFIDDPDRWIEAGKAIPRNIAAGIAGQIEAPLDAADEMVGGMRARLPFSPADTGPLSDLDRVGPAFVQTIAGGIEGEQGTLLSTLGTVLGATPAGQAVQAGAGAARDAAGAAAGTDGVEINIHQTFEIDGSDETTEAAVRRSARLGLNDPMDEIIERLQRELGLNVPGDR